MNASAPFFIRREPGKLYRRDVKDKEPMKTITKIAIMLIALSTLPACNYQLADEIDSSSDPAEPITLRGDTSWESEHSEMVSVLTLDPADAQRLRAVFESREAELGGWITGERGTKLIELETELRDAATNSQLTETRLIIAQATPLRREFEALVNTHKTKILNALTPTQQKQWQGHQLAEKLLALMKPLILDPAQQQQIRTAAAQAITRHEVAPKGIRDAPTAAAFLQLEQWVEEKILSQAQRQNYAPIKGKKALRSLY
jgi:hypothetical protein